MPLTPAQLEAIKQQCIFCQIASGKISSRKIYEDEYFVGVLDIAPANPGHTLVISKEHYSILPEIPDLEVSSLGIAVKQISHALLRALKAQGTTVFVANGAVAGQRAPHTIVHIIPRVEGDGVGIVPPQNEYEKGQREALAKELSKLFGGPRKEPEKEEKVEEKAEKEEKIEKKEEEKKVSGLDEIAEFLLKGGGNG